MAARHSTGVARRRRVRLDASRPRTHPKQHRREPAKASAAATLRDDSAERASQRDRLFKATSIIACCRLVCSSLLDDGGDPEVMVDALQAAYDLVDAVAGELHRPGGAGAPAAAPGA